MATNGMATGESSISSPGSTSGGSQVKRQKFKELVRPIFQESYFSAEYCLLGAVQCSQPTKLSGLYVIPSAQSAFLWFAVLFIHSGPWHGGIFRFTLKFPDNFPDANQQSNLPTIQFVGVYPKSHPLINPSRGTFDIKRYYKTYSRSSNHIWQLLKCTRKIFYKLDVAEKVVYPNKTAAELYLKSQEQFLRKCEVDVQNSLAKIYDNDNDNYSNDANYIRFSKDSKGDTIAINPNATVPVGEEKNSGIGLSWMGTGT